MALPYELYIRFLATKGLTELSEVNELLAKLRLFPIAQKQLDDAWYVINNTFPKGILSQIDRKLYGPDFLAAMNVIEVKEMWCGEPCFKNTEMISAVKTLYDIPQDPLVFVTTNALLIKRLSPTEITRMLTAKFSTPFREKHIELYSKFFFDPKRMTRSDWKLYLKLCNDREKKIYFTALTESEQILKTELDLPSSISVSDSLQWLLTKSLLKAKTFMDIGTPEADSAARAWTDQVVKLADKYEKYRSGDQNDFAKTLQMEFDFIGGEFDTPDSDVVLEVSQKLAVKEADSLTPLQPIQEVL